MASQTERRGAGEPRVGQELGIHSFEITSKWLRDYFEGLDLDPHEAASASVFPRAVAPSMAVASADEIVNVRARYGNDFGNLWTRQEWELYGPLQPGERGQSEGRVIDIYPYRGRTVVLTEVVVSNAAGELAARGRHHQSFLLTQSSGEVKLRDPKEKEGARRFRVPAGDPLDPLDRTISIEMCGAFFHGRANYHTDQQAARDLGFREIVVGGRMTLAYVAEVLERGFGSRWWRGGQLDIKFTNIVWPGDHVFARGVVTDERNGLQEASLWVEKEDGTVVAVGSARIPTSDSPAGAR